MAATTLETGAQTAGLAFAPVGARVTEDGVHYRVWAPETRRVRVVVGLAHPRIVDLARDAEGFFAGRDPAGQAGDFYRYELDGKLLPDPASRFQPAGVEGPSQVVDSAAYRWKSPDWRRPPLRGRVIYELHVGTFTKEGTFRAAIGKLDALVDLGVNAIELMPLGDFAGRWNWGYDGVMIFAPARCYGTPDDLRALVDAAHARGLAVIIDVVYNHLGPCGNVLPQYSPRYFHTSSSIWGQGLNFDEEQSAPVRQFFLQNACMWFDEYRCDGLRLDAVHAIHDRSSPHIIAEIAAAAHARGAFVIAEDDRNDARIITPAEAGGWGVDGMWSDDFHHSLRVALTGQQEAHFSGYRGTPAEWADTLRHGWHYRGQEFPVWKKPRGSDAGHLPRERFVLCISNHDQVGNRPLGDRLHAMVSPAQYRAASMLLCLLPYTPMIFMGQEWGASTPFPFFTDLPGEVGERMRENRLKEFQHYQANYAPELLARMPDPQQESTFHSAKLRWEEREKPPHAGILALYRACLRLRAKEAIFHSANRETWEVETIGDHLLALRGRDPAGDWLLVGTVREAGPQSFGEHPLAAPRPGRTWEVVLASNDPRFGAVGATAAILPTLVTPGVVLLRER